MQMFGSSKNQCPDENPPMGSTCGGQTGHGSNGHPAILHACCAGLCYDAVSDDPSASEIWPGPFAKHEQDDDGVPSGLAVLLFGMILGFPLAIAAFLIGASFVWIVSAFYLPPVLLFAGLLLRVAICDRRAARQRDGNPSDAFRLWRSAEF